MLTVDREAVELSIATGETRGRNWKDEQRSALGGVEQNWQR